MPKLLNILTSLTFIIILLIIGPSLITGIKEQYRELFTDKTKVGRFKIVGEIDNVSFAQQQLEKFFKDGTIKAILLEIDSSGGTAGSSQALFNEILQLKTEYKKPVVVLSYNLCTSGAYYIACASDCIIASPAALIGNIAGYIGQSTLNNLIQNQCIGSKNLHPEQEQMLQQATDNNYQQFLRDVAHQRGLSLTNVAQWANGKIFTGEQALTLHLVDELGSEYNARLKIKQLALIERDIEWIKPICDTSKLAIFSLLDQFRNQLSSPVHTDTSPTYLLNVSRHKQRSLLSHQAQIPIRGTVSQQALHTEPLGQPQNYLPEPKRE